MTTTLYCITKFQKLKSNAEITAFANHNLRQHLSVSDKKRIDATRSASNITLINTFNVKKAKDLQVKLNSFYIEKGITVRKDNVLAIDLVVTTSPEYWPSDWQTTLNTARTQKFIKTWVDLQLQTAEKEFGAAAIKFATLHLDETTPHIHFLITPEQEKVVTYKNRHGSTNKTENILNAKRFNPSFWTKFVTNYAKAHEHLGLLRGSATSITEPSPMKNLPKEYSILKKENKLLKEEVRLLKKEINLLRIAQKQKDKFKDLTEDELQTLGL